VITKNERGEIETASRRLKIDGLDESQASMMALAVQNMSLQPEFEMPFEEDYELLAIWEQKAMRYD